LQSGEWALAVGQQTVRIEETYESSSALAGRALPKAWNGFSADRRSFQPLHNKLAAKPIFHL
jgi:hypothetical protein